MKTLYSTIALAVAASLTGAAAHAASPTLSDFSSITGNFDRPTQVSTATDNSNHVLNSNNRTSSVSNTLDLSSFTVSPNITAPATSTALDTQGASIAGKQIGGQTTVSQGGLTLDVGGSSSTGGGYKSPVITRQNSTQSNTADIGGNNDGSVALANVNAANGDAVLGNSKSVVGSPITYSPTAIAGNQSQSQGITQSKTGSTSSSASAAPAVTVH